MGANRNTEAAKTVVLQGSEAAEQRMDQQRRPRKDGRKARKLTSRKPSGRKGFMKEEKEEEMINSVQHSEYDPLRLNWKMIVGLNWGLRVTQPVRDGVKIQIQVSPTVGLQVQKGTIQRTIIFHLCNALTHG